jgi:hypothetical protein
MTWASGRWYDGTWFEDKQHGFGISKSSGKNAKPIQGEWVEGKRSKFMHENSIE